MNTKKSEIKFEIESQDNTVSPGLAGNVMLTMEEIAKSFREECDENKKFIQKVRPPKEGSFVLIFEVAVDITNKPMLPNMEHPLITRYQAILKDFFDWKIKLAATAPEIKMDALVFEGEEHKIDPISLDLLDPTSATSAYAARTFQEVEAEASIKEVRLYSGDSPDPFIRIPNTSYSSFEIDKIPILEPQERRITKDMVLIVESPVLTGRNIQWKFYHDNSMLTARVTDTTFIERVTQRSEQFLNGDKLEAKVEILQQFNPRQGIWNDKQYTVVEVIKHSPSSPRLFD